MMFSGKKFFFLIVIIILLIVFGWNEYSSDISTNADKQQHKGDSTLYKGESIKTFVYDITGKLSYTLSAKKLTHYDTDENTWFTQPVLILFDDANHASWQITSNQAKLTKDKITYLNGNVIVKSLDPTSELQSIKTNSAKVNLNNQDIESDEAVKLEGNQFFSNGLKMRGNLLKKSAAILENVNTYYGIPNNE